MDDRYPKDTDPRPKRRKDKDNPYTIFTVGIDSQNSRYYVIFKDSQENQPCLEISKELFDLLDQFELEDISFMNEVDRHYERLEQTEAALCRRAFHHQDSVEEIVSQKIDLDVLRQGIRMLPETQRRRLVLYYYEGLTYERIAEMEGCTIMPVKRSIDAAIKKLKKYFN